MSLNLNIFLPHRRIGTWKAGPLRSLLRAIGPTWEYSPFRRLTQALCFLVFLALFFHVCWPYSAAPDADVQGWPSHYADDFASKEILQPEAFLALDPLVSISAAIGGRRWVWSLTWAAAILAICVIVPRGFCSFICPLGTLIDLFDWAIGKHIQRFRVKRDGWWIHLKYGILSAVLISALCGILLSGFVSAIPVLTRGMQFILAPVQMGVARGWHQVPPLHLGHYSSIVLFLGVLALGVLRPRFWCRYLCPSGAIFSLNAILTRVTERKVGKECADCGKCATVCPFDAIKSDYTTRTSDCTMCQTCGGACSLGVIRFVLRWDQEDVRVAADGGDIERSLSRRTFLGGLCAGAAMAAGTRYLFATPLDGSNPGFLPVRPPMSLPEQKFLRTCIRCGQCFKVCPNNALQPLGFEQGLVGLWTPALAAKWSGCEPSCANCAQVCPSGAIRNLPLSQKRVAHMGLAIVSEQICLPYAGKEACEICANECKSAGYNAIEFERVHPEMDEDGMPIEGSGFLAPVVIREKCVGCGICQSACHRRNVKTRHLLNSAAITVHAGDGKEDRIEHGLYTDLRAEEEKERFRRKRKINRQLGDFYK